MNERESANIPKSYRMSRAYLHTLYIHLIKLSICFSIIVQYSLSPLWIVVLLKMKNHESRTTNVYVYSKWNSIVRALFSTKDGIYIGWYVGEKRKKKYNTGAGYAKNDVLSRQRNRRQTKVGCRYGEWHICRSRQILKGKSCILWYRSNTTSYPSPYPYSLPQHNCFVWLLYIPTHFFKGFIWMMIDQIHDQFSKVKREASKQVFLLI